MNPTTTCSARSFCSNTYSEAIIAAKQSNIERSEKVLFVIKTLASKVLHPLEGTTAKEQLAEYLLERVAEYEKKHPQTSSFDPRIKRSFEETVEKTFLWLQNEPLLLFFLREVTQQSQSKTTALIRQIIEMVTFDLFPPKQPSISLM